MRTVFPNLPGSAMCRCASRGKILAIRAGVNNVMDKDPPVVDSFIVAGGQAKTYDIYDLFGRQLVIAFTARF